jgi:hypothetical protein
VIGETVRYATAAASVPDVRRAVPR